MTRPYNRGLKTWLALAEAGLMIHREFLRREHPNATEDELDVLLGDSVRRQHESEFAAPGFRRAHRTL